MKRIALTTAAAFFLAAGAFAANEAGVAPVGAQALMTIYPGAQVAFDQGRVRAIYGMPMTPGVTPAAAAALFLQQHGDAFGAGALDLRQVWTADLGNGRQTVFAYRQYMDGMPVEHGIARVLVLKGVPNRVVYAAGTPAPRPAHAWPKMQVDGATAVALVGASKDYAHLTLFSAPELVVYQGEGGWIEPVRCWKFVGEVPDLNRRQKLTFFVDAATGAIVNARNEVLSDDVSGTVQAKGSPGFLPDEATNAPVNMPLKDLQVSITGGAAAYTDASGAYTIPNTGTSPVTVNAALGTASTVGRWVSVDDRAGPEITFMGQATPGTPFPILLNQTPSPATNSLTTAQVNAFIHGTKIHDYYRTRAGDWDLNDSAIRANVNLSQTCNAFFDGSSINFFRSGGGCVNTAYSDVVAHEYGHWIVSLLGLGQGGFGEGFADTGALLSLDSGPILGRDFSGPNTSVRNVNTAGINYPCSASCGGESHCCGQILGSVWWTTRTNFGTFYGSAQGLARVQQLEVDWMLITMGGAGPNFANSANPTTAIEVLTVNDDDGILANGTPDYARICPAFAARMITCPPAPPLAFVFPNGLPELIQPNTAYDILFNVGPMSRNPSPNTGQFKYRLNGTGSYVAGTVVQTSPNQYRATLPAQPCNTRVDYYFSAAASGTPAVTGYSPAGAPDRAHFVPVAYAITTVWSDDFEGNLGWSDTAPGDNAITGRWTRGIPEPTAAQPGMDHSPLGVMCWVTDYHAGQQVSDFDVDGGHTTLTSPLIDVSNRLSPRISYWRWYSNNVGLLNPNTNIFYVDVSNDDGVSWHRVETLGPAGDETGGGWLLHGFNVEDFVPPTNRVRVRFIAEDITDAIVEAAIDDFKVTALECTTTCYANCDGSTQQPVLNVGDFVCFQSRFAAADPYADCDHSNSLNVADFVCFQAAFAAGCP
jgi:Zn-dependent metalloprotease